MDLSLVLLGSNSTELLWFKGGWFPLFLQLRDKWCLLILGVFPKHCWLLNYFISKKYVDILYIYIYIYKLISYKCLMCTLTIRFMKNLWNNLNSFKLVCVNISLYFENYEWIIFVSILKCVLKTYGKSWLKVQYYI